MIKMIYDYLAPPVFEGDRDKTHTARILNSILQALILALIFAAAVGSFFFAKKIESIIIILILIIILSLSFVIMRIGHVRTACKIFLFCTWTVVTCMVFLSGGMNSIDATYYASITVMAGLLLGRKYSLLYALLSIAAGASMVFIEKGGIYPPRFFPIPAWAGWLNMSIAIILVTSTLNLALRGLSEALTLSRQENEERRKIEERLHGSLHEKEILLKEIHHRVKNNMQIISSLISLQLNYISTKEQREQFLDIQSRVRSMALVHEQLYRSANFSGINLGEYLTTLKENIFHSFHLGIRNTEIHIDVDNLAIDLDRAIPIGLIVNELVTNAIKYAFTDGRAGRVDIVCREDGPEKYLLRISDNGVGIADDIDFTNSPSLGLQIVNALVMQIRGTISLEKNGGTRFNISF